MKKTEPASNKQLILVVPSLTIYKELDAFLIVTQVFTLIPQLVFASLVLQTVMLVPVVMCAFLVTKDSLTLVQPVSQLMAAQLDLLSIMETVSPLVHLDIVTAMDFASGNVLTVTITGIMAVMRPAQLVFTLSLLA